MRDAAVAAWDGVRQLLHGSRSPVYFTKAGGNPLAVAGHNVTLFASFLLVLPALAGALRRLPLAYGVYALLGILMHLSTPTIGDPLRGFDRYASLRFPLFMWAAAWAIKKGTARTLLICSAVLLALFTLQFSTWHVVGAPVL